MLRETLVKFLLQIPGNLNPCSAFLHLKRKLTARAKEAALFLRNIAATKQKTYFYVDSHTETMTQKRILIVDDEPDLREILRCNLESAGYAVDTAASAEEALRLFSPEHSLLLLDVMLGGMSGFRLAEKIRKELKNNIPIIFITAKDTENDLLTGFSSGGDDYIAKPFSIQEVLARVAAILRRTQTTTSQPESLSLEDIKIDFVRKVVSINGEDIRLSPKEFGILSMLARNIGRVFSREEILAEVWHGESYVLERTVDVHIARIRQKLGACGERLTSRQGYGYCFE